MVYLCVVFGIFRRAAVAAAEHFTVALRLLACELIPGCELLFVLRRELCARAVRVLELLLLFLLCNEAQLLAPLLPFVRFGHPCSDGYVRVLREHERRDFRVVRAAGKLLREPERELLYFMRGEGRVAARRRVVADYRGTELFLLLLCYRLFSDLRTGADNLCPRVHLLLAETHDADSEENGGVADRFCELFLRVLSFFFGL